MPNYLKKITIISFVILIITGILATVVEYKFILVSADVRKFIIRFHVSWTVLATIVLGMVLEGHVKKWWKKFDNKQKILGLLVLVSCVLLIITSFVLRHIKVQEIHEIAKLLHTIFGFVLMVVFVLHKFLIKAKS